MSELLRAMDAVCRTITVDIRHSSGVLPEPCAGDIWNLDICTNRYTQRVACICVSRIGRSRSYRVECSRASPAFTGHLHASIIFGAKNGARNYIAIFNDNDVATLRRRRPYVSFSESCFSPGRRFADSSNAVYHARSTDNPGRCYQELPTWKVLRSVPPKYGCGNYAHPYSDVQPSARRRSQCTYIRPGRIPLW